MTEVIKVGRRISKESPFKEKTMEAELSPPALGLMGVVFVPSTSNDRVRNSRKPAIGQY